MLVELVRTTTSDGLRLDGALYTAGPGAADTCAVVLHGVQSNFYAPGVLESLVAPLSSQNVDVLRVNTRGHDNVVAASSRSGRRWQGAAYERVEECRFDIDAWLAWARERGFERALLAGHSLGALKCLYAAAHAALDHVQAIVAISPPRLSYAAFRGAAPRDTFLESLASAERLVQAGQPEALFEASFPLPLLITAAGYLDKYGPEERYNYLRFVERITQPTLITFGEKELADSPAFIGVPAALAAIHPDDSRTQVVTIAGADHAYAGQHAPLAHAITGWLKSIA